MSWFVEIKYVILTYIIKAVKSTHVYDATYSNVLN